MTSSERWLPLVLIVAAGCRKADEGLVLVASSMKAPTMLQSEARQLAMPARIDAPIRFENRSANERTVALVGKGCSCYGVATTDRVLELGERLTVAGGDSLELFFMGKLAETEGDQAFRAGFQISLNEGVADVWAECELPVVPDLVLEPESIVLDLPATAAKAGPGEKTFSLLVRRVVRGKPNGDERPVFEMEPALLRAGRFEQDGAVEGLGADLWRSSWKTMLSMTELPVEIQENGGRFRFDMAFPATADGAGSTNMPAPSGQGALPLASQIVVDRGDRRIEGHLVLRRSKGIIGPSQLHFGALPADSKPRTRRIVLTAADQVPFVATIRQSPPGFQAEVDSAEPATQQWVTVTMAAREPGDVLGELTITTTHPLQKEFTVTLKGRVQ